MVLHDNDIHDCIVSESNLDLDELSDRAFA